jgi:mRNA interferase RelE/StbE
MSALYGFAYSEAALVFLEKGVPPKISGQIRRKIEALAANAIPPGSKKLRRQPDGEEEVHRIRSGDYRVLYVVREPTIVILDIDHRKDIYR